jgi:membrane protein
VKSLLASWPGRFVQTFMDVRALSLASLLAWGMLNTFLPLLLGILALIGLIAGDTEIAQAVEQRLLAVLPTAVSTLVRDSLAAFQRAAGTAGLISLGFLLFNGSNFFVSLESVFDLAYHVPERNIIAKRVVSLVALFVVTGLLVLVTAAALLSGAVGQSVTAYVPELGPVIDAAVGAAISIAGLVIMLVLMYWLIPNNRRSLRRALPGSLVASVLLLLILRLFPVYVALFGQGFSVYAAFGTILLFMLWLYIVGVVLMGGAVLNAFLEDPHGAAARASLAARALTGQLEPDVASEPLARAASPSSTTRTVRSST